MFIPEIEYKSILSSITILCVYLLIINNGKFLLLKRENEPAKGEYWFPGGRLLKFETIRDASLRKSREEVNLECDFKNIISVEETIFKKNSNMSCDVHTVNIVCKLVTNNIKKIKLDNLHSDFLWVSFQDIFDLNLHAALLNPLKIELSKANNKI